MGFDRTTRHNLYARAPVLIDGCPRANMPGLLSLSEVAPQASMSTRFIRKHLAEIPHYRASVRGKIWIDWTDFRSWIGKLRVDIGKDNCVVDILREAGRKRSGL